MPNSRSAYATLADIEAGTPEFEKICKHFIDHGVYFDATITAYGYVGARGEEYDYWIDEREFFTPYVQEFGQESQSNHDDAV